MDEEKPRRRWDRKNKLGRKGGFRRRPGRCSAVVTEPWGAVVDGAPLGGDLPTVTREVVRDLLPDLKSTGGYVLEKVEGLAVQPDGTAWLLTDNDATDDSSGETMFWSIGTVE